MNKQDFTVAIVVDATPRQVFDAVNNVRGWWSEEIDGRTDQLGAEFKFHYKDFHRTTHKITEMVPGKRVVWHTTESYIGFVEDKKEWDGTDIVFDITAVTASGDRTELRFTHAGLVPAIECYGKCSGAWGFYVQQSLRDLLTTGKGQPNTKAGASHVRREPAAGQ
jgi:hypothetical protein